MAAFDQELISLLVLFLFFDGASCFKSIAPQQLLNLNNNNNRNNNNKNSDMGSVPDPKWHNTQKTELKN